MHSHHSHSGQYVQHAKDFLDAVVETALEKQFQTFCLTEHMPRYYPTDLYDEELESKTTVEDLAATFDAYYTHAKQIQAKVNGSPESKTQILVGFEAEGISPFYFERGLDLLRGGRYSFDLVVGSVHHVHNIPIDYDADTYEKARAASTTPTDLGLFEDYFDLQYEMLRTLNPSVVGHFDLIRLFAPKTPAVATLIKPESMLWDKIKRNIDYAVSIGALFELNSAAVRKGWETPYPQRDIAELILERGGRFCLSDDSHGIAQVGLNLHKCVEYLESLGAEAIYYLALEGTADNTKTVVKSVPIADARKHPFWVKNGTPL